MAGKGRGDSGSASSEHSRRGPSTFASSFYKSKQPHYVTIRNLLGGYNRWGEQVGEVDQRANVRDVTKETIDRQTLSRQTRLMFEWQVRRMSRTWIGNMKVLPWILLIFNCLSNTAQVSDDVVHKNKWRQCCRLSTSARSTSDLCHIQIFTIHTIVRINNTCGVVAVADFSMNW